MLGFLFGGTRCFKCDVVILKESWGQPCFITEVLLVSATIKQPTLGTETSWTLSQTLHTRCVKLLTFAYSTSNFALKTQIDVEHQLVSFCPLFYFFFPILSLISSRPKRRWNWLSLGWTCICENNNNSHEYLFGKCTSSVSVAQVSKTTCWCLLYFNKTQPFFKGYTLGSLLCGLIFMHMNTFTCMLALGGDTPTHTHTPPGKIQKSVEKWSSLDRKRFGRPQGLYPGPLAFK